MQKKKKNKIIIEEPAWPVYTYNCVEKFNSLKSLKKNVKKVQKKSSVEANSYFEKLEI